MSKMEGNGGILRTLPAILLPPYRGHSAVVGCPPPQAVTFDIPFHTTSPHFPASQQVATLAAAALWGLSTSSGCRRSLAEVGSVPIVITAIKRSLKLGPQASVTQVSVTAASVTAPPGGAQEEAVAAREGEAEGEGGRMRTCAGEGAAGGYGSSGGGYGAIGSDVRVTEAQRAEFQRHLMGAFAMLMVRGGICLVGEPGGRG